MTEARADVWAILRAEGLAVPTLASDATGVGVVVAIVDTGVNFDHPHLVGASRGGVAIERDDGELVVVPGAARDHFGHGTCCAALVHALAPGARLFSVRVTGDRATTDADRVARGIDAAVDSGASIVAVALGTSTVLRAGLDDAVRSARDRGAIVVAPEPRADGAGVLRPGPVVLPAGCPGALAVAHRDGIDVASVGALVVAEGRARPAEGHVRNFWGPSLATARAAAALARFAEGTKDRGPDLVVGFKKALLVL